MKPTRKRNNPPTLAMTEKLLKRIESGRSVVKFHPKRRLSEKTKIAWGYKPNKEDPLTLDPIPEHLILLFKAQEYLFKSSYAEVSRWLEAMTGVPISPYTLRKLLITDYLFQECYELKDIPSKKSKKKPSLIVKESDPVPKQEKTKKFKTIAQKVEEAETKEDKQLVLAEYEVEKSKARQRILQNKVDKLKKKTQGDDQEAPIEGLPEESEASDDGDTSEETVQDPTDIIWRPNPGPQTEFLESDVNELFFGGARGGSKSEALVADPLRYCGSGAFRGLLIRKRLKDLREIISRAKVLYPKAFPGTRFLKQESMFVFPSGATLEFGYAENDSDIEQYQGQEYAWIGIDELPQFKDPEVYSLLRGSCRTTDSSLLSVGLPMMRMTGNPGNVGSPWVKRMFIDPAPAGTVFNVRSSFVDPRDGRKREVVLTRQFIQSSVFDTPQLLQDESYLATLSSLPEHKKLQWLYGNWDVIENAAFPEFDREVHVIEPFEIPVNWPKIRCTDWGYSSPFCTLWIAFDKNDTAYVYREYYGQGILADDFARRICFLEREDSNIIDAVIDGSTNIRRGESGPSIYEMIERELAEMGHIGNRFADRSPGSREAGKQELHKRLAMRPTGAKDDQGELVTEPGLYIFNNCLNLVRTMPLLEPDENDPEVVSKKNSEDHAYDALHYGLRSRPMSALEFAQQRRMNERNHQPMMIDPVFGY